MYEYYATLSKRHNNLNPIYDGDTVWLTVDLGFGVSVDIGSCRLYGINAPEMRGVEHPKGVESRDWLRNKLNSLGKFRIKTYKSGHEIVEEKGKYGRWLVDLIDEDGSSINEQLVEKGYAIHETY